MQMRKYATSVLVINVCTCNICVYVSVAGVVVVFVVVPIFLILKTEYA